MKLYVRSFDRRHSLELLAKGVDFEVRETFESALAFGRAALEGLGMDHERAAEVADYVRNRDLERLALQQAEGITAGRDLAFARRVQPEPLSDTASRDRRRSIPRQPSWWRRSPPRRSRCGGHTAGSIGDGGTPPASMTSPARRHKSSR